MRLRYLGRVVRLRPLTLISLLHFRRTANQSPPKRLPWVAQILHDASFCRPEGSSATSPRWRRLPTNGLLQCTTNIRGGGASRPFIFATPCVTARCRKAWRRPARLCIAARSVPLRSHQNVLSLLTPVPSTVSGPLFVNSFRLPPARVAASISGAASGASRT